MPSDILLMLLKDMPDLIDTDEKNSLNALKHLAKLFDVSVAALTIKISGVLRGRRF
jgi:hypothetical protein